MSNTHPLGPHFRIAVTRPMGQGTKPGADPNEVTEILILKAPREGDPATLQLAEGAPTSELATEPRPAVPRLETAEPRARRTSFLDDLWRRIALKRAMPGSR